MKHFRFGNKIKTSLNFFFFIYFQGSEFSRSAFGCHESSDPGKQARLNLIILSVLWSRNVHSRQQPERIVIFILSGLSLSRPVDTKPDFNLNNIIATLSLISIS